MNCKPGDLAVIVRTGPQSTRTLGMLVNIVKRHAAYPFPPGWKVREQLVNDIGITIVYCEDCCLRPIRDNDGDDETLIWAGKPEGVAA